MKKVLALILVCMMAFGCSAFAESKGVLKMATNATFPPYEFYGDEDPDTVIGIDVDIAAALCEKMGYELEVIDMDFSALIPAVAAGKADFIMAGLTVTKERAQSVDFSDSYATGIQSVIVPVDSPITSVDDLFAEGANNKIGVQMGTTGDIYCTGDIMDAGLGTVEAYNNGTDAVMALTAGKLDCVVIDNQPALKYVEANEGLKVLDSDYVAEDYAIALAKGSELTEPMNAALAELIADGTVQSILDKYIVTK